MLISRTQEAYNKIRDAITYGDLKPGERLVETVICKTFNIGRTPVREAFRQLQMEGFIDIYPEKGAVINIISIQDVQQIYDIIGVLEGFSTELVTMSIKASDNKKLRSLHKDLKKVGQRKNYKEWLEINSLFHGYFPQMSGNPHLINIINLLRRRIYRYRFIAITIPGHIEEYIRAHEEILEAISKKNAKGAGRAMVQHVFHVKEVLVNFLKQYPGL